MRVDRVIQESADTSVLTRFHPRVTVVHSYEGSSIRCAATFVDAVCGDPDGVHVELHLGGRELAVFRPDDEPHRVVDVAGATDISEEFRNVVGVIDLLVPLEVSRLRAEGAMLVSPDDCTPAPEPKRRRRRRRGKSTLNTDAIEGNIVAAQEATAHDEPLPVVVVDLFESLSTDDKSEALNAVVRASSGGQVIVVTNDEETIELARYLEMSGELAVSSPTMHFESAHT